MRVKRKLTTVYKCALQTAVIIYSASHFLTYYLLMKFREVTDDGLEDKLM